MMRRSWIYKCWIGMWFSILFVAVIGLAGHRHVLVGAATMPEKTATIVATTENTMQSTTEDSVQPTTRAETKPNAKITLSKPKVEVTGRTYQSVTLSWKKVKNAKKYVIFRKDSKKGKYKKIGTTKKLKYKNKKLKKTHTYYYRVAAMTTTPSGDVMSKQSKTKKVKTKAMIKRTAYVGDSVMTGMGPYAGVKGKGKKVIAKIGVSPGNFWSGPIMDDLLDYNPDRIYIMLGMNALVGDPNEAVINSIVSGYKKIINDCKSQNKNVEIVVLAVSPTSSNATVKNSAIKVYNQKLKKMAKQKKVYYYDYTADFRGANGCLKSEYDGGDGIHWTAATYQMFKKKLDAYGKKLDKK